jgi:hypothetical protein
LTENVLRYRPAGPTVRHFHLSETRRRVLIGPVGSGKSFAGCMEIFRRAVMTPPAPNGIRYSRFAVIRRTYPDLARTTIVTYEKLFARGFGKAVKRDVGFAHNMFFQAGDGTFVDCQVIFFSMTHERDVARLMSLELTGAFVNEARELPKAIFDTLDDRISRYPDKPLGGEFAWFGWWADTNPPDREHWMYKTLEEERPEGWEKFHQPGGVIRAGEGWQPNPKAENIHNHNRGMGYYLEAISGKADDHIAVYYGAEYGFVQEGKLVIPEYRDRMHTSECVLEFMPGVPLIYVGFDFGATPACALVQQSPLGQWRVIKALQAKKVGIRRFLREEVKPLLQELAAAGHEFVLTGDPAGDQTSQTDGKTPFKICREEDVFVDPAHTNDFEIRRLVIADLCMQLVDGEPAFLVSKACSIVIKGLAQKYVFREQALVGEDESQIVYKVLPDKNEYSHTIEAVGYAIMGSEHTRLIGKGGEHGRQIKRRMSKDHRSRKAAAIV